MSFHSIARSIFETHSLDNLPILADALEDGGDAAVAAKIREEIRLASDFASMAPILIDVLGLNIRVVVAEDDRRARRRARIVSAAIIQDTAYAALASSMGRAWKCRTGGGVANAYGYAAATDAVVCAAKVIGDEIVVAMWATEIPANKSTTSGAMAACLGSECRALADDRYGDERKAEAREALWREYDEVATAATEVSV